MLVLSRKEGESIEFRDLNVCVRVIQLKKSKVQLGIEAPREIQIDRSEIVERSSPSAPAVQSTGGVGSLEDNVNRDEVDQQLLDELAKLEVEVLALSELVASKDRDLARQTATVSLERVNALRKTLSVMSSQRGTTRSMAEFMRLRSKRIEASAGTGNSDPDFQSQDEPVSKWDRSSLDRADCIRQAGTGYFLTSDASSICSGSLEAGH